MKYRKKPVGVEAVQWTGHNDEAIKAFVGEMCEITRIKSPFIQPDLVIHTLEGDHHALVDDFIIKGVHGEFYPCKPDIFHLTYEEVSQ